MALVPSPTTMSGRWLARVIADIGRDWMWTVERAEHCSIGALQTAAMRSTSVHGVRCSGQLSGDGWCRRDLMRACHRSCRIPPRPTSSMSAGDRQTARKFAQFCAFGRVGSKNCMWRRNFFQLADRLGCAHRILASGSRMRADDQPAMMRFCKKPRKFSGFSSGLESSGCAAHGADGDVIAIDVACLRAARHIFLKKICAEVLTVKKTVIRFRSADVAV